MAAADIPHPPSFRSSSSPFPILLPHLLPMPEIQPSTPPPQLLLFDDDDDDGFGDFTFASNPVPAAVDDEWGDFVSSPIGSRDSRPSEPTTPSSIFDPFPHPTPATAAVAEAPADGGSKAWERPSGALPLSLFGDEEAEESENAQQADSSFVNGFSSSVSSGGRKDGDGLGSKGDLKDLIVNLYCQAPPAPVVVGSDGAAVGDVAVDDEDLDWEFQDAFTSDAGLMNKEKLLEIHEAEKKADANGHGFEIVVNRLSDSQEATSQHRISKIEHDLADIYVARDGISNGFDFGSVVVDSNICTSETNQENKCINNGNALAPRSSLENGENSDDDNWDFQNAYSEVEGSLGHEKIPDTEGKVPVATAKTQGAMDMWENNLGDLTTLSYNDDMKDLDGPKNDNDASCEPTSAETESKIFNLSLGVDFNDIILNLYNKDDRVAYSAQNPSDNGQKSVECGYENVVNDASNLNEMHWELQNTLVTANSSLDFDKCLSTEPMQNILLDFYIRLKKECLFMIVHHIDDFKKVHEVTDISGEHEGMKMNEEVQAAYRKLEEAKISEDSYRGRYPSRDVPARQLLEVIREPHFKALEQEYQLEERILSAEKDLISAMELLEHTILVLKILGFASKEEQHAYIIAWYKMAQVCAQELQHGAVIWEESLDANVSTQILSQGNQYFLALGEIYRATEILRASLKLFMPWILSSQGYSLKLITCLEKCAEAWMSSGLEKVLASISDTMNPGFADRAKTLSKSIRDIHDLNELSIRDSAFSHENILCKLSLLPIGALHDVESVVWNGGHYYLKLANLWANRISSDPAQLPQISASL